MYSNPVVTTCRIFARIRNLPNVTLVEVAISNICGTTRFYEDNVTGQNNSLLSNYENAEAVAKSHGVRLKKHVAEVPVTTLDAYVQEYKLSPDFIKMDIEGAELNALLGSTSTLAHVRGLMIEVTRNHAAVASLLREDSKHSVRRERSFLTSSSRETSLHSGRTQIQTDHLGERHVPKVIIRTASAVSGNQLA